MKPRIVVLGGAGAMGRIMVRDLQRTGAGRLHVVVADRDVAALRRQRVETVRVDVTDRKSLRRALKGAYATIASLPYRYNLDAMRGAADEGVHYVDLGGLFHTTRRQLTLAPLFKRRGVMAILGMGSAPGIVNILAAFAAQDLDRVRSIDCLVGNVDRTRYRYVPPLAFGYSPDTVLDEFTLPSAVFRAGRFGTVPALDPGERIMVRFPPPLGRLEVDSTLHSEVATLPLSFRSRGVREVTFRQSFDREFRDRLRFVVELGLADLGPLGSGAARRTRTADVVPRDVLLALVARSGPPVPVGKPALAEVLRAVVSGTKGGRRTTVTADCHAGPASGWGIGPDIDTGAPPSIAVQLMLSGELELRPGVWAPEQVVPVAPFVRELGVRGMRVRRRRIR